LSATGEIAGIRFVPRQVLPRKSVDNIQTLGALGDLERLRLAARAAGEATFDWEIADDAIFWDGAVEILSPFSNSDALNCGAALFDLIGCSGRERVEDVLNRPSNKQILFDFEFHCTSAVETAWFEMRGIRVPDARGATERIAGIIRIVTEQKHDSQRLTYLATRDELTGHLNRTTLRSELGLVIEEARNKKKQCAYFVAAIDRLAVINEAYGFGTADEVIVTVGERLSAALRDMDLIGRIAGNKFGIVLGTCSEEEMNTIAARLRGIVGNELIATRRGTVSATISVGAVLLPESASSGQEAMLRAEEALDRARSSGRDGFSVYTPSPQREMARLRLMTVADEVAAALRDNRLVFAYQPIVSASSHLPVHYECLLRLVRSDGSIASAGHFIPAAEQLGLVRQVDRRALEMAIAELHAFPAISLAVNVSGTIASDRCWLESFVQYVRANEKVAPRMLVELTETAALNDFEDGTRFISDLREMGCKVAIDDFGAGFTSFRNLKMLRVDMVKIDGGFVRGLASSRENQIFVRTLVELAKHFHLATVAEWVGSAEEVTLLENLGVDFFQGFHCGEPSLSPVWRKNSRGAP
jgi:diguanylate cyclase (GGDEF)-like protein